MVDFPYPDLNMTNFTAESARRAFIPYERVLGEFVWVFILLMIGWALYKRFDNDKGVLAVYLIVMFTIFGPILNAWVVSFIMLIAGIIVTLMIIKRFLERDG